MRNLLASVAMAAVLLVTGRVQAETTLTIATVNNGQMIQMQKLTSVFESKNPGIKINWVTLEENQLRQRVTTDIATQAGQFDIITIGSYEVPIWGKKSWLLPLNDFPSDYEVNDLIPAIRSGLTVEGNLYAAPFYGESSMVFYRTDLLKKANLVMPDAPSWNFIATAADKMTDRANGIYGICLRGKAGWGENMAFLTTMSNSFGGSWFNMDWRPQFDQPGWRNSLTTYLDLMKRNGPPGASSNGFNENLALFQAGKCGIWIDATVAASFIYDPKQSKVATKTGVALAPDNGLGKRANWLWAWSLAIPATTKSPEAAKKFVAWATSKPYIALVQSRFGVGNAPPGTRSSLYRDAQYSKQPFAKMTLDSINRADPSHPTVNPVPYVGVQFVAIPEFQAIGTEVGEQFSAALAEKLSAEQALKNAQELTERAMKQAGYYK